MFRGAIPRIVSRVADEHLHRWKSDTVYVACSGSFTVERHLAGFTPPPALHSNDVLLYSAAIGNYFSGSPMELRLSAVGRDELGFIAPALKDPTSALAALLIVSQALAKSVGKGEDGAYYSKLRRAYENQWDEMLAATVRRVEAFSMPLASYTSEDAMTWLDRVPKGAGVVAYPPFQAGGAATYFARDFADLEGAFEWDPPDYTPLEDDNLDVLYEKIADRREWLFAVNKSVPGFEDRLRAVLQTTNRAPRIHLYSSEPVIRRVAPHQELEPAPVRHLVAGERIEGRSIRLAVLGWAQFAHLRSIYMNANIRPGQASLSLAVIADDRLVGVFAYSFAPSFGQWPQLPQPVAYMLSDFPVHNTDYPRLAKLIVMASVSEEATQLLRRHGRAAFRSLTTTAYSKHPTSMKYRGVFHLVKREANHAFQASYGSTLHPDDTYYGRPWALQYGSDVPRWSLREAYDLWLSKHGELEVPAA